MSDSLEKLVKEIDTLTYNARSVINALIRSVLANSSTNGFTIKRSGIEIKLSRPLIYRLSRFYEEWANNDFFVQDPDNIITTNKRDFDTILTDHDTIPVKDENQVAVINQPTTAALVIHSKILFLNSDNISRNEDTQDNISYWLGLIKTASNPKLITNSAPVPLNLRTPIFDENLSTARYLTSESYLFPYAYFALDTLGYSGDGVAHQLGGLSWDIVADQSIRLLSNNISVGGINPNAPLKTLANRVGNFGFAWGYDTHARGDFSTAGGMSTFALGERSVAIGGNSIASEFGAVAIGSDASAPGYQAAVVGGSGNKAVADYSAAFGGIGNTAGEEVFSWVLDPTTATTPDGCFVDLANCTATLQPGSTTIFLNKNILVIQGNVTDKFNAFDSIKIFDFTIAINQSTNNQFFYTEGNAFSAIYGGIASIAFDEEKGVTKLTLFSEIPYANVDGGSVVVISRSSGFTEGESSPGLYSFVTGLFNIASGFAQTVVGKYNKKVADAKFIVGTGDGDSNRKNSLVVTDTSVSAFGIEGFGPFSTESYVLYVDNFNAIVKAGLSNLTLDNFTISMFQDNGTGSSCSLFMSDGFLSLNSTNTIDLSSNGISASAQNNISLFASFDVGVNSNTLTLTVAEDTVLNNTRDLTFTVGRNARISWAGVLSFKANDGDNSGIGGKTYGALPTNFEQYSHVCGDGGAFPQAEIFTTVSNVSKSGFYQYYDATADVPDSNVTTTNFFPPFSQIGGDSNKAWLLNISGRDLSVNNDEVYDAWQIAFGIQTSNINNQVTGGHIAVRRARNSFGATVPEPNGRRSTWRFLAWKDELDAFQAQFDAINSTWTILPVTPIFTNFAGGSFPGASSPSSLVQYKRLGGPGRTILVKGAIQIDAPPSSPGPAQVLIGVSGISTSDTNQYYPAIYKYIVLGVTYTSPAYVYWSAPNQMGIFIARPGFSGTHLGPDNTDTFAVDGTVYFNFSYQSN